ncbi:hypothetical protein ABIB26_000550 [Arthrobacter sp. UYEF20]
MPSLRARDRRHRDVPWPEAGYSGAGSRRVAPARLLAARPPAGRGEPRIPAGGLRGAPKQPGRNVTAGVCGAFPVAGPGAGLLPGRTCPFVAPGTGHERNMSIRRPRRGACPDPGARAVAPLGASGHFPGRRCPVFAPGTGHSRNMSIGRPRRGACAVRWSLSLRSSGSGCRCVLVPAQAWQLVVEAGGVFRSTRPAGRGP